ncbi:MAG: hypothetical protein LBH22_08820 [Bacteroidales bacterium]|jgi:hypothetical protein|nr:hypothetical protein [Bacteroidales bacterium]
MSHSTVLLLINIGLIITYILFGLAVIGALIAAGKSFATSRGNSKMALLGAFGIVVIFIVSWFLSSGTDISEILFERTGTPLWWSRPVGAGLISFYILFICVVSTVIGTEIMKPFKK